MTSAAGVRYVIGKLRLSRFQQGTVRRLPSRKSSSILQSHTNVQYRTPQRPVLVWNHIVGHVPAGGDPPRSELEALPAGCAI